MAKTRLASEAIDRAETLLNDIGNVRWSEPTLIDGVNDAQLAIATLDYRATRATTTLNLVQGYRQAMPADALALLDGTYNGAGEVVTPIRSRLQLDLEDPGWTTAAGSANAQHLVPPAPGEKDFVIYPVQPASPGTLDIVYAKVPVQITAGTDTLGIEDEYFNALVNYLVYRAQQQDDDNTQDVKTSDRFYQAFLAAMPHQAGGQV